MIKQLFDIRFTFEYPTNSKSTFEYTMKQVNTHRQESSR